ncbi:subtilisin like protease [Trichoderma guizhouense]|uniref:Subtilisin like protease n=1 Tax=Trichoderma guizhouense TaxID=1491466 RepID=A0A1T3C4C5_9HYPO|nr:subtilisin like protease [Trichoderma guizhouense]
MRTPRIVILVLCISASFFLLFRAATASSRRAADSRYPTELRPNRSVWGLIFYNTPFSLFPPNAAISLTDDNSTSFAARPAAFGPRLRPNGLSGQLWVGSGFIEDSLDGNGELGCSDLPGWDGAGAKHVLKQSFHGTTPHKKDASKSTRRPRRSQELLSPDSPETDTKASLSEDIPTDDGTDNHLHERLPLTRRDTSVSSHADIQSIQEGAEIKGKIVLLMRGGCGFLEKVMWAQRRGAIGVIVGDNVKGGPLIQMFARGDEVDNVTIPSVFTARTTAQLLSSLTQPGSFIEDTLDDNGNPVLKVQQGSKARKSKDTDSKKKASSKKSKPSNKEKRITKRKEVEEKPSGWFKRLFSWGTSSRGVHSESRPPSSGQLDWVMVEDWEDEQDSTIKPSVAKPKKQPKRPKSEGDDFVIGVHDWRDPDVMGKSKATSVGKDAPANSNSKGDISDKTPSTDKPKGGSITPGSGEYKLRKVSEVENEATSAFELRGVSPSTKGRGLISRIFGDDEDDDLDAELVDPDDGDYDDDLPEEDEDPVPHEGLWVTITPTSSASPFFDTLLVLVISPLVTLSIVYALLVLRARIRRRRWRAPKSVVERLPVRTYHTVARSPSLSPRVSSPTPTTPLLQHTHNSSPPRSRPRSRTTTGVMESANFLAPTPSDLALPQTLPQRSSRTGRSGHERGAISAEWKKYMGRQVECVVCLEEYVDGVSRVMRLPCGHEFHADCITPWLTTRRRTCPICKGDVVRSMARGSWAGPRYEPYHDDGEDDDDQVAEGSGSRSSSTDEDLEQGVAEAEPTAARRSNWQDNFFFILPGGRRRAQSPPPPSDDRQT